MMAVCLLCNSTDVKQKFKKKELLFFECSQCGFLFLQNNSNPNFDNSLADFEPAYLAYLNEGRADAKNHQMIVRWMSRYINPLTCSVLDIGCGSGKFVNYLQQQGCAAYGIEPSAALYHHFLSGNQSFACTTVNDYIATNPNKQFDVITAFDVLEHVEQPAEFLSAISKLMHPDTLLFLSTPNSKSLHQKLTGKRWHYFNRYHFSYFSKATLLLAANKVGLFLISASHRARYFETGYLTKYFQNFLMQKKSSLDNSANGWLLRLNLFDNMYCVLKKQ